MNKLIIAVDIDEVLAASAESFIAYTNDQWGMDLTIDDYHEHWAEVWKVDHAELLRRAKQYNSSGVLESQRHFEEAEAVLTELAQAYKLVIATARRRELSGPTEKWLEDHYGGIFSEIHYAGIWDTNHEDAAHFTKAALCQEIGADYLIDDQLKHCGSAAESGISAILFGNYTWNQAEVLHPNINRCSNWHEVLEYFNEQGR